MKKKSRHRLNEMKENEAKRKSDEVDTITHSLRSLSSRILSILNKEGGHS